jgi:hypothetical protein
VRWFNERRATQQQQLKTLGDDEARATAARSVADQAIEAARGGTSARLLGVGSSGAWSSPGELGGWSGPGDAMRAAQQARKDADQQLAAAQRARHALEAHLWRSDPVREQKARRLEGV